MIFTLNLNSFCSKIKILGSFLLISFLFNSPVAFGSFVVLPPHSTINGATLAQYGERWWQWLLSIPNSDVVRFRNPQYDQTGSRAFLGDQPDVFFLAGNTGGNTERTFTIPAGKNVFIPLPNTVYLPDPGEPLQNGLDANANYVNTVTSLHASIDGNFIPNLFDHRETTSSSSTGFTVTIPADGIFAPGIYSPAAQDGYWLMISGLTPGEHVISFGGSKTSDSFSITDHITVVPIPAAIWLFGSAFGIIGWFRMRKMDNGIFSNI